MKICIIIKSSCSSSLSFACSASLIVTMEIIQHKSIIYICIYIQLYIVISLEWMSIAFS